METFRSVFPGHDARCSIGHDHKILMIGSCFSTEIGSRLDRAGFDVLSNPFGTLFNPSSIGMCLHHILSNYRVKPEELFFHQGLWRTFLAHSSLASPDKEQAVLNINRAIEQAHAYLEKAEFLFLTYGTAWAYCLQENGTIVANCHKLPGNHFVKRKLGINEIISEQSLLNERLKTLNEKLNIVYTISPVRHLSDGFAENNWSKSTLNVAVHELVRRFEQSEYFPAYEIVMDDLRDYRFYDKDLVHPNELAVDYVWKKFADAYFTSSTRENASRFESLFRMLDHRNMNNEPTGVLRLVQKGIEQLSALESVNPLKTQAIRSRFEEKLKEIGQ